MKNEKVMRRVGELPSLSRNITERKNKLTGRSLRCRGLVHFGVEGVFNRKTGEENKDTVRETNCSKRGIRKSSGVSRAVSNSRPKKNMIFGVIRTFP